VLLKHRAYEYFEFRKFKVLIDFAHNASGYKGVEEYLQSVDATKKIGIIAGIGDRRDEDIRECATIAARMFDHIIIRQYLRGRSEIINFDIRISASDQDVTYEIIPKETRLAKTCHKIARKEVYYLLKRCGN
jgi:cyanophycin synthetase